MIRSRRSPSSLICIGPYDISGLHDLATAAPYARKPLSHNPPKLYAANLRRIVQIIQRAGVSTIVWALNTPVHDQWHTSDRKLHRRNNDVIRYNQIAAEVMAESNIPINDLFQPIMKMGLERSLMRDGVHLRHEGSALLGKIVANQLLQYC